MSCALLPGSYDPITNGHVDVIRRAALLFDKVIVLVSHNSAKHYTFCAKSRLALAADAIRAIPNASADAYDGMLVDYIASHGHPVIVKGIRNEKDFLYEQEMAIYNRQLSERKYGFAAETLLLPADTAYAGVSSTLIRTLMNCGGAYDDLVPNAELMRSILNNA